MPYATCDRYCTCGEYCEELEERISELESKQLSTEQEKKLEEYERLRKWLIDVYKLKPSDLILGLDRTVAFLISEAEEFQNVDTMTLDMCKRAEKRISINMNLL